MKNWFVLEVHKVHKINSEQKHNKEENIISPIISTIKTKITYINRDKQPLKIHEKNNNQKVQAITP